MTQPFDESSMAFQFGRICREIFPESSWEECEFQLRRHWEGIRAEATWERVRDWVLKGWSHQPPSSADG